MSKRIGMFMAAVLLIGGMVLSYSKPSVSYDNTAPKEQLITKTYTSAQIAEMMEQINGRAYGQREFLKAYDVECLRKFRRGYYAVFEREDGKGVYVFLDSDFVPIADAVLIADSFKTRAELLSFASDVRTRAEVMAFDPTTLFPFSGRNASIHQAVEGIVLIDYESADADGREIPWDEEKVRGARFVEEAALLRAGEELNVPYILGVDKRE